MIIMAHCEYCGALFRSRAFGGISGNITLTLTGNKETCPNCGQMANIADGVFDIAGDVIRVISAPDITKAMYQQFLDLTRKVRSEEINHGMFVEMADAIDPRLGKAARIFQKNKKAGILVLVLLWLYMNVNFDIKMDVNKLYDQVFGNPEVEYVLPDKPIDELERYLGGDDADAAKDRAKEQKPKLDPLLPQRKNLLMVSVSHLALMAAL